MSVEPTQHHSSRVVTVWFERQYVVTCSKDASDYPSCMFNVRDERPPVNELAMTADDPYDYRPIAIGLTVREGMEVEWRSSHLDHACRRWLGTDEVHLNQRGSHSLARRRVDEHGHGTPDWMVGDERAIPGA